MIQEKSFASTQVRHIKYDSDRKVMVVTFVNGSIYQYNNVPEQVWEEAIIASSIGKYFNENIKSTYSFVKVK